MLQGESDERSEEASQRADWPCQTIKSPPACRAAPLPQPSSFSINRTALARTIFYGCNYHLHIIPNPIDGFLGVSFWILGWCCLTLIIDWIIMHLRTTGYCRIMINSRQARKLSVAANPWDTVHPTILLYERKFPFTSSLHHDVQICVLPSSRCHGGNTYQQGLVLFPFYESGY